jgi:ribosome maturation factor RimP
MISENLIREKLEPYLEPKGLFIIDISISPHNQIDEEDFSLTISSPDANKPLQTARQYPKHIGKEISVITKENKEFKGKLTDADANGIKVLIKIKGKKDKKTKTIDQEIYLPFQQIKKAKILLPF